MVLTLIISTGNAVAKRLPPVDIDEWRDLCVQCQPEVNKLKQAAEEMYKKLLRAKLVRTDEDYATETGQDVSEHVYAIRAARKKLTTAIKNYRNCIKDVKLPETIKE